MVTKAFGFGAVCSIDLLFYIYGQKVSFLSLVRLFLNSELLVSPTVRQSFGYSMAPFSKHGILALSCYAYRVFEVKCNERNQYYAEIKTQSVSATI